MDRFQAELGITAAESDLAAYYQTLVREGLRDDLCVAKEPAAAAQGAEASLPVLRVVTHKMIANKLIDCSLNHGAAEDLRPRVG